MRKALAFAAILTGALAVSPGLAAAFQEVPVAPAPQQQQPLAIPGEGAANGSVTFEAPATAAPSKADARKGLGIGSLNVLPKLDFGLELLYSNPKGEASVNAPLNAPMVDPSSPTSDDVQILGTVKRRF